MPEFELRTDFAAEVLDESERVPVVVDFWAPWCGPCRVLSPVLEKLAREAGGRWKLVTVNTDENPELAELLRLRSIPTVFLFSHAQPVATFSGALPEKDVREWLARYVPAAKEAEGNPDEAQLALNAGKVDEAKRVLAAALKTDPKDNVSRLRLARLLFAEDLEKAAEIALAIPEEDEHRESALPYQRLRDLARWARGKEERVLRGPEADIALYRDGIREMLSGRYEIALRMWLDLVRRNRELDEDGARKALVSLLVVLGDEDPLTREYRRLLASVLF